MIYIPSEPITSLVGWPQSRRTGLEGSIRMSTGVGRCDKPLMTEGPGLPCYDGMLAGCHTRSVMWSRYGSRREGRADCAVGEVFHQSRDALAEGAAEPVVAWGAVEPSNAVELVCVVKSVHR